MSIQAVAWALEQDLPARPKLVLVSIANHASHVDGYCWLKAETIAFEAACSPRGVFNFVGDLVRNGFVRKAPRKGDDGKQRANDYWILFDREPNTVWVGDRKSDDPQDGDELEHATSCDPDAPGACGETGVEPPAVPVDMSPGAVGPHAPGCSPKSPDEPSKTKPEKSEPLNSFAAPPRSYKAPPIVPEPQGATHTQTNERVFVYRGTPAWDAWMAERKRRTGIGSSPTYRKFVEGVGHREGWDFPTLFPPSGETEKESSEEGRATGPPSKKPA